MVGACGSVVIVVEERRKKSMTDEISEDVIVFPMQLSIARHAT